jgi:Na+(H+)/acetate symporter ActP
MRRALFGLFWFGVLWMATIIVGAGVTGAMRAPAPAPAGETFRGGPPRPADPTGEGIGEFRERHGTVAVAVAAALAALGSFSGVLPGTRPLR